MSFVPRETMTRMQAQNLITQVPLPLLIINRQGKIVDANEKISDVFLYDGIRDADIFALTGNKAEDIFKAAESGERLIVERNDKVFRLNPSLDGEAGDENALCFVIFYDITNFEMLKDRYNNEKPCALKIEIDNYEELINPTGTKPNNELAAELDILIRNWAGEYNCTITKLENNSYIGWMEQENLDKLVENKFEILDKVRTLETGEDYPASLSIGIGVGGKSMTESEGFSEEAIELALGRGGDQAVIRRRQKSEFFGGKLQAVEKNNKGKSRIIGHVLKQLMDQSKNVIIMGHRAGDMDSFGASLGIARIAVLADKKAFVVIDEVSNSLDTIYEEAKSIDDYEIISSERALEIATSESLLVVVDTHRKALVQCPQLIDVCEKIAIIDHHRRLEDMIEDATLTYMQSYASSASEMVTEVLQFTTSKKEILKSEAEALLAGIMVDTNSFAVKTGVRTFEAAAWLRRQGADTTEIKRFFQEDLAKVKLKSDALARATVYDGGIAVTHIEEVSSESQILCAQLAEQLLTIKGITSSYVLGTNDKGQTVISARSLGEVNVQVVMEKMGGGGHLTVAASQVDMSIEEAKCKILEILEVR